MRVQFVLTFLRWGRLRGNSDSPLEEMVTRVTLERVSAGRRTYCTTNGDNAPYGYRVRERCLQAWQDVWDWESIATTLSNVSCCTGRDFERA